MTTNELRVRTKEVAERAHKLARLLDFKHRRANRLSAEASELIEDVSLHVEATQWLWVRDPSTWDNVCAEIHL